MPEVCTHLDQIRVTAPAPEAIEGCAACLATGGTWVHLRTCLSCGEIGCCDSSPNRHASKHAASTSHPIVQSAQPNEDWCWCYVDETVFAVDFER